MNGLKYILKDIALMLAVFLILNWTGAKFEWYHWLVIAGALFVATLAGVSRGIDFSVRWFRDQEPCDDPNCKSCVERKAKV